jgi:hypothetical protein
MAAQEKKSTVEEQVVLEFYELPTRRIKISRFFEVARYLTENGLWDKVEKLLSDNPIIGERILLDSVLGNAVKVVIDQHVRKHPTRYREKGENIAYLACNCAPKPKPKPEPTPGGERG